MGKYMGYMYYSYATFCPGGKKKTRISPSIPNPNPNPNPNPWSQGLLRVKRKTCPWGYS